MNRFVVVLTFLAFSGSAFAASGTTYNPTTFEFDANQILGYGQGVSATCAALSTTNIDLTLSDDVIMTGAVLVVGGASLGDYFDLQVLAGGSVVATPIQNWYLPTSGEIDYQLVAPKKIVTGLKLRVVVHTTALLVTPFMAVNYKLWKVLQ